MTSEFGKGLSYCLALFLCHSEREPMYNKEMIEELGLIEEVADNRNAEMWFNGASDHLYELQIPKTLPITLQKRLKILQNKCLNWGHGFGIGGWKYGEPTLELKDWAVYEAKELIRLIDKSFKIKTMKGSWQ